MTAGQSLGAVKVVFRYDDIFLSGGSPERNQRDLEVIKTFLEERVPLSVAVIPGDIRESEMSPEAPGGPPASGSPAISLILANRDQIEICQHGYRHALAPLDGRKTEFAGRSADDQRQ